MEANFGLNDQRDETRVVLSYFRFRSRATVNTPLLGLPKIAFPEFRV